MLGSCWTEQVRLWEAPGCFQRSTPRHRSLTASTGRHIWCWCWSLSVSSAQREWCRRFYAHNQGQRRLFTELNRAPKAARSLWSCDMIAGSLSIIKRSVKDENWNSFLSSTETKSLHPFCFKIHSMPPRDSNDLILTVRFWRWSTKSQVDVLRGSVMKTSAGQLVSRCGTYWARTGHWSWRTEHHMLLCLQLTCRVESPRRTVTHRALLITHHDEWSPATHLLFDTSVSRSISAREGGTLGRKRRATHLSRLSTPTWGSDSLTQLSSFVFQLINNLRHSALVCEEG